MTAEVCVMNRLGMALAADSAVTMIRGQGPKIYQSADKLFLLSEADPVAIMVYGSASLLGVPWETIVKRYRKLRGSRSYATVEAHAKAFRAFLVQDRTLFPKPAQRQQFRTDLTTVFRSLHEQILEGLKEELESTPKLTVSGIRNIVGQCIKSQFEEFRKANGPLRMPAGFRKDLLRLYAQDVRDAIEEGFEKLPMTKVAREQLQRIAQMIYNNHVQFSDETGIVLGGFGRSEVFPALVHFNLARVIADIPIVRSWNVNKVSEVGSCIIPFAQKDMVQTFMEGVDPKLQQHILGTLDKVFAELPEVVAEMIDSTPDRRADPVVESLRQACTESFEELQEKWRVYQGKHLSGPVMNIVSMLPKDELAAMAESLVSLTILRRRSTPDAETVAGPIDVAVVTKGDGFVWIKRKHYFDPALNPRYMARVARGERP